jgi:hypothetical protein
MMNGPSRQGVAVDELLESARIARRSRDWPEVRAYAQAALDFARASGDLVAEGRALRYRGIAKQETEGGQAAVSDLRRAITILNSAGDLRSRAAAESDLAGVLISTGNAEGAAALIDSADHAFSRLGLFDDVQLCQHQRAWADLVTGACEAALRRARESIPMDRAMMSIEGEGWALQTGAIAATFLGRFDVAATFAAEYFSLARIGGDTAELLDAHLIHYRLEARRGDREAADRLLERLPGIDGLGQPVASAVARVIVADARLGTTPDARAFAARDEAEPFRAIADPWLAAEFRHLDTRWSEMSIRRERGGLFVDLARAGCLPSEHLILDLARLRAAESRSRQKTKVAAELCLKRRNYYRLKEEVDAALSGALRRRPKIKAGS